MVDEERRGAESRKSRVRTMDGKKKKGFPQKMFFYISSFSCPRINLAQCSNKK